MRKMIVGLIVMAMLVGTVMAVPVKTLTEDFEDGALDYWLKAKEPYTFTTENGDKKLLMKLTNKSADTLGEAEQNLPHISYGSIYMESSDVIENWTYTEVGEFGFKNHTILGEATEFTIMGGFFKDANNKTQSVDNYVVQFMITFYRSGASLYMSARIMFNNKSGYNYVILYTHTYTDYNNTPIRFWVSYNVTKTAVTIHLKSTDKEAFDNITVLTGFNITDLTKLEFFVAGSSDIYTGYGVVVDDISYTVKGEEAVKPKGILEMIQEYWWVIATVVIVAVVGVVIWRIYGY